VPRPLRVHPPAAGRGERVGVLDLAPAFERVIGAVERSHRELLQSPEDPTHVPILRRAGELGLSEKGEEPLRLQQVGLPAVFDRQLLEHGRG
jgi:hypothetical protein